LLRALIAVPACVINAFTKPNAGRAEVTVKPANSVSKVKALTALKLWVREAVRVPNGPLNDKELIGGVPLGQLAAGRRLFKQQGCDTCHGGGLWSSSVKTFASPPANSEIGCEVDLGAAAPPGSACTKAPVTGKPVAVQSLSKFLRDIGSFELGVAGGSNPFQNNIGAPEKATQAVVAGVSQPPPDALGRDYNDDRRGAGYSPQSLLGVFAVQPYMHNGACESINCVLRDVKHRTNRGKFPDKLKTASARAKLRLFVESIDAATKPF
jgi:cytochrome c peroxidase